MDVDEKGPVDVPICMKQEPFSYTDCDVYMAPTTVQEVHMASPILTSQPPTISEINCSTLFLPLLEMKTEPIAFPPFNIHVVPRQALDPCVSPRKIKPVSLGDCSSIYIPAVATYQAESPTMANASSQGDTHTSAVHNHNHFPSNPVYRPVTPSPSESRPMPRDVSPISMPVMPIDVLEIGDTLATTLSPLIESTSSAEPDRTAGSGDIAPNVVCTPWPDWSDEQEIIPSTPHVVAETNTPEWTVDEDATPLSPILETTTSFYWPEITFLQEYILGADLIDLLSPNSDSPNSDNDDSVLRAFGGSNLEDLDWILEGFRATSVADACFESKNSEAMFVSTPLYSFSPVSPYDWTVPQAGPDSISFDSTHDLCHSIHSGSFELPSFKSGDVIQTESNGLFQTTPAPYIRLAYEESLDVQSRSSFDPLVTFSKVAYTGEKNAPRSTKTDASTQTEDLPGATYSTSSKMIWFSMFIPLGLPRPHRYSPYLRYSPYRKLRRDFTFDSRGSGDMESTQPTITSGTSCSLPSPVDNVFLDCSAQASIISKRELEVKPVVCINLREPREDDQEKEVTFPGAYPIEQVVTPCGLPSPVDNVFLDCSIQASIISERELEARPAVCINLREPEDDQEKEMTFPGAYPIEQVVHALDEPAKHIFKAAQKNRFEAEGFPCPAVHPSVQHGFKELFFRIFAFI